MATSAYISASNINCKVVGITDGDTLTCLTSSKQQIKVRLNQIDAPKSKQAFGTASKKQLSDYVFGKDVTLKSSGTDRYKRTLAEVFYNNQNINKRMVASGYAWAYRQYLTDNDYLKLEATAKQKKLGLWLDKNPIYPSRYRQLKLNK